MVQSYRKQQPTSSDNGEAIPAPEPEAQAPRPDAVQEWLKILRDPLAPIDPRILKGAFSCDFIDEWQLEFAESTRHVLHLSEKQRAQRIRLNHCVQAYVDAVWPEVARAAQRLLKQTTEGRGPSCDGCSG
jgi:hypothetical protein